jgi:hypothetical protein
MYHKFLKAGVSVAIVMERTRSVAIMSFWMNFKLQNVGVTVAIFLEE